MIDGKQCLVIEINDQVEVNGVPVRTLPIGTVDKISPCFTIYRYCHITFHQIWCKAYRNKVTSFMSAYGTYSRYFQSTMNMPTI